MAEDNNPTLIDRFAEWVSPAWQARREAGRLALREVRQYGATYRGGIATRTGTPFGRSLSYSLGTYADRRDLASMRDRARRVWRENPIGRSILQTEVDNVVAEGFTLQAKTVDRAFNAEAEDRFEQWLDVADARGMLCGSEFQRTAYRAARRDGDGGIVLVDRGGDSRLQWIPGDLLHTPDGSADGPTVVDGIEVDASGRPVAFHLLDADEWGKRVFTRVDASNFIYLTPDFDDDLAVRCPTCYGTIFELLDQASGFVDGVVTAARMATVFGLVWKKNNAAKTVGALPMLTNSQGNPQRGVTLENGSIKVIGTDEEVVQVQPTQPMQQTPDFIRALMRLIGLPFDMPLEMISKDMSTVNFASARIGLLGYYRATRSRQKWFVRRCLDRIYRWWISRERKRQALGLPDAFVNPFPDQYFPHLFLSREWDYTDPVSECQSDMLQCDLGIKSPQMVAAERGRDWEEIQVELAAAQAFRRANELPTDLHSTMTRDAVKVTSTDPSTQDGGGGPASPPPGPTPAAPKGKKKP